MSFFSVRNPNVKNLLVNIQHVDAAIFNRPTSCHIHPQVEIAVCTKGECIYYAEQKQYPMKVGDCIFLNAYVEHSTEFLPTEAAIDIVYFRFEDFESKKILRTMPAAWSILKMSDAHVSFFSQHIIYRYVSEIIEEFRKAEPYYELFVKANIFKILGVMYRENQLNSPDTDIDEEKFGKLKVLFDYLDENYNQNITLESVSDMLGFNKTYFSRMFKNLTGHNFSEHLTQIRLNKAIQLLSSYEMNIAEISDAIGFSSPTYFNEVFKKYYKCTPAEFRKKLT